MSGVADVRPAGASGDVPTREELVERARALRPLLREDAGQADRDRELTQRVIDAITDAGLLKLMVPKRLGGYETDIRTLLDVVGELGRGDLSASWVSGVLNFTAWQVALLPEQAQREVWEDNATARICSVISPAVQYEPADRGITITAGRWPAASGSQVSEWAFLTVPMAFGPEGPEFNAALIPISDLTIEDTWFPAGVRGSSSRTLLGADVFVPEHRMMSVKPALDGHRPNTRPDEPLYASSFAGVAGVATLAPQLGLADAVLELVTEQSQGRMIPTAGVFDQSESPAFQMRVAEASAKIETAWMLARRVADEVDEAAARGDLPDDRSRGRARMFSAWACEMAHDAVESLMSEAGLSSFMDDAPLQRMWRDSSTAARHTAYRLDPVKELYGRIILGKGPGATMLF